MKTEMEEVCKNILYSLDALNDYAFQQSKDENLKIVTTMLLSYAANLDPERVIPPPLKTLTMDEVVELLKEDFDEVCNRQGI